MMRRVVLMVIVLCMCAPAFAADDQSALSRLDSKISAGLAADKWHYASKTFVRVLWEDYRKAHITAEEGTSTRGILGKMPDVRNYEEYLGAFGRGADSSRAFLEILKGDAGRFYVKLEGHTIPAVQKNKTIVFTTGDVVYAPTPQLADKPYCTLELYMVIRAGGEFFLADPSTPPDKWMPLARLKGK